MKLLKVKGDDVQTMKNLSLIVTLLLIPSLSNGQPKSFEFSNPHATELTKETLDIIVAHAWKVVDVVTENRGNINRTNRRNFFSMRNDQTFKYGSGEGKWVIQERRYISFRLDKKEDETLLNFGGIYAVTSLTDTTLTLTKILTSSHDMKRVIHLKDSRLPSSYTTRVDYSRPFAGHVSQQLLDSLSELSPEILFMYGFVISADTIFFETQDSLYKIIRKKPIKVK